jgi:hypothetical protein
MVTKNSDIMKDRILVVLAEYNSPMEAELAKSLLTSAGIYVELENEFMSTLYPPAVPCRLMVCEEELDQAKKLLFHR